MFKAVKGFTLVEMMLVAGILAIIGLTIVATFSSGLRIFYRMEGYNTVKADVLISIEKMERDLKNAFSYRGIEFIGSSKKVTFPGLIRKFNSEGRPEESLGAISYYLDDSGKTKMVSREENKYTQAIKKDRGARGPITRLASIEGLDFKYYVYDPESDFYSWASVWDKSDDMEDDEEDTKPKQENVQLKDREDKLPLGVKIEVSYKDGDKIITLNRAVFIQPAVSLNLAKVRALKKDNDNN
ncbi:MAG: prepilin-type N-terminal cleavage/methylation domain-containing protein [Candidatus Omnitrophica bacterium]|nr:prepilin-type N-terminal cleavage/methylation domain-containing protein [Candidatus Omnitrophota bacterium]MBU1809336.1 prepilin-type N-terminal cleavage/methylation domain-containing protein [Candidatus Omnitrophota bacterium]